MQNAVEQRGIKYLVHFTRIENVVSIFNNGLVPVDTLRQGGMSFSHNDDYRMDNCEDANCLSIQFPNYRMFFKYRNENPGVDWVVLGIKKEVLWEKDCAFCIENAASNNVTSTLLKKRKGVEAFNRLYNEYPGKPTRTDLGIKPNLPTHPQAEALVFDVIEPEYIWGVAFESLYQKKKYASLIPSHIKSQVKGSLFSYRDDYEHWR
ncbi:DarT ssDNA thymidine ADP-ribosyltransferase family protein [Bacillus sp. Cr_A10]|uniref:DarT ssDNA thymidine ADP-ribosyltransferase family protein n=1 Tax=Bacillus sp. Cr_A10 TaxID=3033993 RepID=UPI0023DAD405|nr:DarT ssDNA thymidine ADP-ribosyltransferase family protein [Bacillus sp. Cr_A10]MDF2065094.1 DarT ssDNA thymidine ADP-ribosyltransferase family protein [Bacillus sp. Cr_A10]